jgi:SDR family mycofactocin-dependent oxidoreductase
MGRVEGKVALITGAARGQGRSHALRLAHEGASIIAVDICADVPTAAMSQATPEDLQDTVKLVEAEGGRILAEQADVRDLEALRQVVQQGVDAFGRLDVVCANAGIVGFGLSAEIEPEAWRTMLDVNVTGVWNTCTAASPAMVAAGNGGSIIITGSVGSYHSDAGVAHYATAKHGIVGLMRTLAIELAPQWIRVNLVCPTNVNTPMIMNPQTMNLFVPESDDPTLEEFETAAKAMHVLDLGWIEPEDVSNAVLFLASDESRYVTGIMLPIDAGASLK